MDLEQKLYQQGHINHSRFFTQAATRDIAYFEAGPHFKTQHQRKKYVQGVYSNWEAGGGLLIAYFDTSEGPKGFYVTPRLGANYF